MTSEAMPSVVVTGGSRGIGQAVCRRLRDEGWGVVSLDLSEPHGGTERGIRNVIGAAGDPDALERAFDLAAELGALRGFVANAGITQVGAAVEVDRAGWDGVVDVNLSSVFEGARVAFPRMDSGGSIVVMSSIAGVVALPARAAYCATKAGLLGLVRSLAVEWGPFGIRVNAVAPGHVDTELNRRSRELGALPPMSEAARTVPLRRFGEADEVAGVVAFLLSPASGYVSGVTLPVDGGMSVAFPGV